MSSRANVVHYQLLGELAHGGMATVFVGRAKSGRKAQLVAIKRIRQELAEDKTFAAMFLDEATLTARIKHPNVVPTLDLTSEAGNLLIVMEYVDGVSVARLLEIVARERRAIPPRVAIAIACDLLRGLHAAHELTDENGRSLSVVHRDVSPPNVLVGVDGFTRILDFGVAKASTQLHVTVRGEIKGKLAYMPPEQAKGEAIDRRSDVYAAGVVLWEMLVGRRLFNARSERELIAQIFAARIDPPSMVADDELPARLDPVVLRALASAREDRWPTAEQMADALAAAFAPAQRHEVTAFVRAAAAAELAERAELIRKLEASAAPLEGEAQTLQTFLTARGTTPVRRAFTRRASPDASREGRRALRLRRRKMKIIVASAGAIVVLALLMVIAHMLGQRVGRAGAPAAIPAQEAR